MSLPECSSDVAGLPYQQQGSPEGFDLLVCHGRFKRRASALARINHVMLHVPSYESDVLFTASFQVSIEDQMPVTCWLSSYGAHNPATLGPAKPDLVANCCREENPPDRLLDERDEMLLAEMMVPEPLAEHVCLENVA